MLRCCCQSSGGKTAVLAALIGAAGMIFGAKLFAGGESAPETSEVVPAAGQPEAEMTPEEMMEFMQAMSEPVAEHEVLKHMAGTWDCEAKMYMAGPDAPPTVSQGVSENKLIMGGRYVVQHFTMKDFMGGDFEGMGFVGYDRARGQYVNNWIDNWSTGIMTMTGEHDADENVMEWRGSWAMATPDGPVEMPAHHIVRHLSDDKLVMEFWELDQASGEEVKGGEITYTRRK